MRKEVLQTANHQHYRITISRARKAPKHHLAQSSNTKTEGFSTWPKSPSSRQARGPRHPAPSPALAYSSSPSFTLLKGLQDGKSRREKLFSAFCISPAFNKGADGVNDRHEATRRPANNPALHAGMLTTSSPVCTCSTSSYNILLLQ